MNTLLRVRRRTCLVAGCLVLLAHASSRAAAPADGAAPVATSHELAAWIDQRVADHFSKSGATQPAVVDDATFLRRAYLDLVGTLPAVSEVRDFLEDESDQKRTRVIDRLLGDPRFAAHLARTWRRVLISDANAATAFGGPLEEWLAEQFKENVTFDELARKLITAGGAEAEEEAESDESDEEDEDDDDGVSAAQRTAATSYLRSTGGDPPSVAGSVSRVFLGVRIECAQCHDHPFTDWTQKDFWGVAAFFAGARYNRAAPVAANNQEQPPTTDERTTSITAPDIGKTFEARFLWGGNAMPEIPEDKLPRQVFADWLTSRENPHFAATAVNRVWQQLCGQGLTDSVDDLDLAEEVERAVVLDDLARHFADHQFDLKWLISGICRSKAYQFAASTGPNETAEIRVRPLKVLSPEQVFDSLEVALALPISRLDDGPRYNGQRNEMIARLGETASSSPDQFRGGIPQMLMLMNGVVTDEATSLDSSRTLRAVVDAPFLDDSEKIETLFLATLTRSPSDAEARRLKEHVEKQAAEGKRGQAYAEILWALINSPEFMLIR